MAPYTQVGKYILKRKIGEGAFAEVRHAVHQETKEEFAVKVFDRDSMPSAHFERDIKKEIKIMQHLRHPNIVAIHAVLVTDKKLFLVMELVRGGELYDEIVSKRRVDEGTSRRYFQQIVDAMVYCHRRGVVHRDLKPENLLLDGNGNVKITDFGMSWIKDNFNPTVKAKQLLRTQCGTPKYMAPEIIVRPPEGYDGEKLDAWECGMVLFALLAGYLPFSGEDDNTVFKSILNGKLRYPSHFSPGAKDLLSQLLEKDPKKRSSLSEIREHFWFLVNYEGDAAIEGQATSSKINSTACDKIVGQKEMLDDAEKENQDPRQNKSEQILGTAAPSNPDENTRISAVKESNGTSPKNIRSSQAAYRSKHPPLHPRKSTSAAQTEPMLLPSPKTRSENPIISQARVVKLPSRSDQEGTRGQRRKTPTPLKPTLLEGQQASGSENGKPDVPNVTRCSTEARTPVGKDKPAKSAKVPTVEPKIQDVATSPGSKPPRDSPRNIRSKPEVDGAKRTPRKNPPLSNMLSSVGKLTSFGGEKGDEEDTPLSFRDRLRSPLANVFKSLMSGAGSGDTEPGADSVNSSWFETSPSAVADLAKRASKINIDQKKPMQGLSSSDEDLEIAPVAAMGAPPIVETPMSPLSFRKMTKVFQKKS